MNWKKVVSVLLVSAMTLSMAACGDTASTSDNAAAGTETKGSTANASSDEKLVVWTLSNDLIDFGKRFQEQTGVEVDTVVIEPADYPTKVQTALLAGEKEPDIIVGEPKMLEDFFDAGFFEDLNQAPYNAQDYADQIVDYVWQVGQDDDGIQRASLTRSHQQVSTTEEISQKKYSEQMIRTKLENYSKIILLS